MIRLGPLFRIKQQTIHCHPRVTRQCFQIHFRAAKTEWAESYKAYAPRQEESTGTEHADETCGTHLVQWQAEDGDQLEETEQLRERAEWRRSDVQMQIENGLARAVVRLDPGMPQRFFRVRKPCWSETIAAGPRGRRQFNLPNFERNGDG
jgi:hypothetical protein